MPRVAPATLHAVCGPGIQPAPVIVPAALLAPQRSVLVLPSPPTSSPPALGPTTKPTPPILYASMATRTASSPTAQKRAEQLVALPSLSRALSSLPQAQSLDHVSLHQPTLASRAQESEAKLRKALSVTSQNYANGGKPAALTPVTRPRASAFVFFGVGHAATGSGL
ncbi:hypothetical protein M0805_004897 [Coniferiporia weirii]|nr:hypothetical protein M0805_004897 [Coniferiporia weirii]